jgi:hypothetical protein
MVDTYAEFKRRMKVFGKGSRTNLKERRRRRRRRGWRFRVPSAVATPTHPIWRSTLTINMDVAFSPVLLSPSFLLHTLSVSLL